MPAREHGFEPRRGVFNEEEWRLFDSVLAAAAEYGLTVIPTFENYWEAYGGIDAMLSWSGLPIGEKNRWRFFNTRECPGCIADYKELVSFVLNRTNTITGMLYRDDPTIFSWELMNEPRYQYAGEDTSGKTLREWVDTMGTFIKARDSNHLLGTGLEGHGKKYGFGGDEGNPFSVIHASSAIDWCSAHLYPQTSWANLDVKKTLALVTAWCRDSAALGKPFVIGEFNIPQSKRATYWSAIFGHLEKSCGAGSLFWWFADHNVDPQYGVMEGAPELAIFKKHSENMQARNV